MRLQITDSGRCGAGHVVRTTRDRKPQAGASPLVRDGFATVKREPVDTSERREADAMIEITQTGRQAIDG